MLFLLPCSLPFAYTILLKALNYHSLIFLPFPYSSAAPNYLSKTVLSPIFYLSNQIHSSSPCKNVHTCAMLSSPLLSRVIQSLSLFQVILAFGTHICKIAYCIVIILGACLLDEIASLPRQELYLFCTSTSRTLTCT